VRHPAQRAVLWGLYEWGHCQARFCGFFLPCSFAFTLSFVRPRRRLSSAPTVDFGRRRAQKLSRSAVAPPQGHTSTFPGRALTASSTAADSVITGRKSALYFSVAWIDVAASTSSPFASDARCWRVQRRYPCRVRWSHQLISGSSVPACHFAACMDDRAGRTGLIFDTADWLARSANPHNSHTSDPPNAPEGALEP
jgi:hypothetical protein